MPAVAALVVSLLLAPQAVVGKTSASYDLRLTGYLMDSWRVDFADDGTVEVHGSGECFDVVRTAEFTEVTPC
jgi:hypothetical protein